MIFQRKNVISSTFAFDAALANSLPKLAELDQGGRFKPGNNGANGNGKAPSFESWHNPREAFETRLTLLVIAGDFAVIALGFIAATVLMEGGFTLAPAIPGGYKSILAVSAFILTGACCSHRKFGTNCLGPCAFVCWDLPPWL